MSYLIKNLGSDDVQIGIMDKKKYQLLCKIKPGETGIVPDEAFAQCNDMGNLEVIPIEN